MIKSMTGFGRGEYSDDKRNFTCEIRSVNHRFCEISVKLPRRYQFAEEKIKARVKEAAPRGKIDVSIVADDFSFEASEIRANTKAAQSYYEALKAIKEAVPEISGDIDLKMLIQLPEVLKTVPAEEDEKEITDAILASVDAALEKYDAMKVTEGEKLIEDIMYRGDLIEQTALQIEEFAPQVAEEYKQKMKARITELLDGQAEIPEDRILLESAVFADKSNITEEIVRLKSHCSQLRSICTGTESAGKKLDFLVQEMNRESNTIGSKANNINITDKVLILKAEIEKIREQVQNLE